MTLLYHTRTLGKIKSLDIELQMAAVIKTSPVVSMEKIGVVLPEQELNWAEPAEDDPAVFSNILDVCLVDILAWRAGGWG